ncbi:MAG TPA: four helix bundle protein [Balneolaceae bacterium]
MESDYEISDEFYSVGEDAVLYDSERDFTTLKAWQKARIVKLFFYQKVLPKLPKEEKYQLGAQIRNASVSGTANIAEGYGRFHYQEGIQFYRIARASLYELKDHLISCLDLNFIDKKLLKEGLDLIEDAKITLNGYINFVKKQKAKS